MVMQIKLIVVVVVVVVEWSLKGGGRLQESHHRVSSEKTYRHIFFIEDNSLSFMSKLGYVYFHVANNTV